jgi:hypothetical protein
MEAQRAMVSFLRTLRLDPVDFYEVRNELGGSPFIGDIVREGMARAQSIVVLLTPDESATLEPSLRKPNDSEADIQRAQPRANVLLEAGMALGIDETRTILVTIGPVTLPSDLHGRHMIRLDNSVQARELMIGALVATGCDVKRAPDWHDPNAAGNFAVSVAPSDRAAIGITDEKHHRALQRMLAALRELKAEREGGTTNQTWITIKTLAAKGVVTEEVARQLLEQVDEVEFSIRGLDHAPMAKLR